MVSASIAMIVLYSTRTITVTRAADAVDYSLSNNADIASEGSPAVTSKVSENDIQNDAGASQTNSGPERTEEAR